MNKLKKQITDDLKTYKKIYIGTTDRDWDIIDNVEKKIISTINNTNIDTYISIGGSYLFPLSVWEKIPKNLYFLDRNKTMINVYKYFVALIEISKTRYTFMKYLYCREMPKYHLTFNNMDKWLKKKYDKKIYLELQNKLKKNDKLEEILFLKTFILKNVIISKNNFSNRQLWPSWDGSTSKPYYGRTMFVSDSETRFASTLWYGVCGYLKSNTTYQNMRNILLNTSIHYLNLDLGDIKAIFKHIPKNNKNIYIFITNVDDGIAYLDTKKLCKMIQKYIKQIQYKDHIYINSVLTGLHDITYSKIKYDRVSLVKYQKRKQKLLTKKYIKEFSLNTKDYPKLENNEYKIIFINYKFIGDFIRRHKLKEQLVELGNYYITIDGQSIFREFTYNKFFKFSYNSKKRRELLLIMHKKKIVGMRQLTYLEGKNKKGIFVEKLIIHQNYRGRKLMKLLSQYLKKYLIQQGKEYLRFDVLKTNTKKFNMDIKNGAKVIRETDKHYNMALEFV